MPVQMRLPSAARLSKPTHCESTAPLLSELIAMSFTNHRRLSCLKLRKACGALCVLEATIVPAVAGENSRGGVVIRNSVPVTYRDDLVRRLQTITGWNDLHFDRGDVTG